MSLDEIIIMLNCLVLVQPSTIILSQYFGRKKVKRLSLGPAEPGLERLQ